MSLFTLVFGALWTVSYTAFWHAGIRAGWAWRKTWAHTAARRAGHAMFWGALSSVFGGLALISSF